MDGHDPAALDRWRDQLGAWAIPEEILAAAPESPWGFPVGLFRARARRAGDRPATPSNREAARFLPPGGSVLDVGAGGGAASLPLAGAAGKLVGVDESPGMVASFLAAAEAAAVPAEGVEGRWPEVADRVAAADVVVLGALWRRFPGLGRRPAPTADDAVAALGALGLRVARQDWEATDRLGFD